MTGKLQVNDILLKQRSRLLPFSEEGQDIRRCVPVKVAQGLLLLRLSRKWFVH